MPHRNEILPIGGQAVIEGVLMRSKTSYAIAVRKPDQTIAVKKVNQPPLTETYKILDWPFIRGIATLVDSLSVGIKALVYSADKTAKTEKDKITHKEMVVSLFISLGLTIGLFIILPAGVFSLLRSSTMPTILLNLIEGTTRLSIFLIFLSVVSLMPDMQRVFEYHGAEHVIIHMYQDKKRIDLDKADQYPPQHPSCGTSFLLTVFLTSIIVFSFLGRPPFFLRILLKIILLPVIAGISYEFIRISRKKNAPMILKILTLPGIWLQYFTTRKPKKDQLEVAAEALRHVLN